VCLIVTPSSARQRVHANVCLSFLWVLINHPSVKASVILIFGMNCFMKDITSIADFNDESMKRMGSVWV